MKRFVVSLISTILAFTAGLVTASSWTSESKTGEPVVINTAQPCPPFKSEAKVPLESYSVTPPREFDFGQNGLRLVPERVKMESNRLNYDIDVSFPQILTPHDETSNIRKINQLIKDTTTKLYQWPINRASERIGHIQGEDVRDTVNFTYQVGLATDSFLGLHFIGYSYNGDIAHQVQDSFTLNFDLTNGKQMQLSDLFKPGSKYLEFISRYTIADLSRIKSDREAYEDSLQPLSKNFDVWQITTTGITFNFHSCRVADCSEGELIVQIPFSDLKPMLKSDIPGRFYITYP